MEVRASKSNYSGILKTLHELAPLDKRALDDCIELLDNTIAELKTMIADLSANKLASKSLTTLPYNVSIFSINSLLISYGFDLMASETQPPLGLNITKALIDGHDFNVAALILITSGVVGEFERHKGSAGITFFVPTDEAFSNLPVTTSFQSLSAEEKVVVLKFHILPSYYPLSSLESIVNPIQPMLAIEGTRARRFT
ncbi:hypothetical protein ACSBR2_016040 [Camellia fascicularis]